MNPDSHESPKDTIPRWTVQGDSPRGLITVQYMGRVAAADLFEASRKVFELIPVMPRGFTLVADLSGLESMELECAPAITAIMDACNAAGIGTVVRIIPDPRKDIGLNILSIIHYRRGVKVLTFQDRAEAERAFQH